MCPAKLAYALIQLSPCSLCITHSSDIATRQTGTPGNRADRWSSKKGPELRSSFGPQNSDMSTGRGSTKIAVELYLVAIYPGYLVGEPRSSLGGLRRGRGARHQQERRIVLGCVASSTPLPHTSMFGGTPKKKSALTSDERLKRDLKRVMSEPCNKICADCSALNPTWASINLGVFLCLDCSGIHRMLGVHISQVRSCSLDTWRAEWIKLMKRVGNTRANAEWEGQACGTAGITMKPKPGDGSDLESRRQFIFAKYDQRKWYKPSVPPSVAAPTGALQKPLTKGKTHSEYPQRERAAIARTAASSRGEGENLFGGMSVNEQPLDAPLTEAPDSGIGGAQEGAGISSNSTARNPSPRSGFTFIGGEGSDDESDVYATEKNADAGDTNAHATSDTDAVAGAGASRSGGTDTDAKSETAPATPVPEISKAKRPAAESDAAPQTFTEATSKAGETSNSACPRSEPDTLAAALAEARLAREENAQLRHNVALLAKRIQILEQSMSAMLPPHVQEQQNAREAEQQRALPISAAAGPTPSAGSNRWERKWG